MLGPTASSICGEACRCTLPHPGAALPELCQKGGCANLCLDCSWKGRARVYRICI